MNALASPTSLFPLVLVLAACQQTPARVEPTPVAAKSVVEAQAPRVPRDGLDGCSADPSGPLIADPGQCVTLVANDPFGWCWSFRRAASGVGLENGKPVNVAAEIAFHAYQPDSFTIGISGGEKGAIVDLGTADELATRFHYSEQMGGGRGFASIRAANGRLMICASDPNAPLQPLTGPDSELRKLQSSASAPVHEGHLYLVHLENPDWAGPITVKLVVLDHQANKSVRFRWLPVEDSGGTARFASARRSPWDAEPSGSVTTLYFKDPVDCSFSLRLGQPGTLVQDHVVKNRDSQIHLGYHADSFTSGVQGGEQCAFVDLGTAKDLAAAYKFQDTVSGGNGYTSIRFLNGALVVYSDSEAGHVQTLREAEALTKTVSDAHVLIQAGHIYLVRVVGSPDTYAKLIVLEFRPGESVTFRWQRLED